MTTGHLPPPRDLPPGRLEQRKAHLLRELAGPPPSRAGLPYGRIALAVGASAVAVAAVGLLATSPWGSGSASAAQVRASLTSGLSTPRDVRGRFSVETRPALPQPRPRHGCRNCTPPLPVPSTFVLGADGSFTTRSLDGASPSVAFDARTNVLTAVYELGGEEVYVRTTGTNPAFTSYRPEQELATWVLHALDSGNPDVRSTRFDGRDAWALTLRFTPGEDYYDVYGARVDVVVDKETGLLLQLTQYQNDPGYWTAIETIHDLTLDEPPSAGDFTLAVPAGAKAVEHDQGFRRTDASGAEAIVGYPPLLPADTGGRPLTGLAAARLSQLDALAGARGPVWRDAVSARYGGGIDTVTVSTRRGTPLDAVPELSAHTVTIPRGALAGATAYVSDAPTAPGFLSAYHDGLVVTVEAPTRKDALAAAETLRRG